MPWVYVVAWFIEKNLLFEKNRRRNFINRKVFSLSLQCVVLESFITMKISLSVFISHSILGILRESLIYDLQVATLYVTHGSYTRKCSYFCDIFKTGNSLLLVRECLFLSFVLSHIRRVVNKLTTIYCYVVESCLKSSFVVNYLNSTFKWFILNTNPDLFIKLRKSLRDLPSISFSAWHEIETLGK